MGDKSTQQAVSEWHKSVFGQGNVRRTAKKVLEEAAECYVASSFQTSGSVSLTAKEAVDTIIAAYAVLSLLNLNNADEMIRERVQQLRQRTDQLERDEERGI